MNVGFDWAVLVDVVDVVAGFRCASGVLPVGEVSSGGLPVGFPKTGHTRSCFRTHRKLPFVTVGHITHSNIPWQKHPFGDGSGFGTSSTSAFALVHQHDTNMEDMDWETEWNELVNNKARVSETQLAGSTQLQVQDFRRWWDRYTPSLPLYRSRSPYVDWRPKRCNQVVLNGLLKRNRTSADALNQVEPADIQMCLIFRIKVSSKRKEKLRQTSVQSY